MKIGIDARALGRPMSGVGNYLSQLLTALLEIPGDNVYYLYANRPIKGFVAGPKLKIRLGSGWLARNGTLWLTTQGRKMMLADDLDIFWGSESILPNLPKKIKTIVTVYDLVHLLYPETTFWGNRLIHKLLFKGSLRRADRVLAISQATADQLKEYYKVDAPVRIISCAAKKGLAPLPRAGAAKLMAERYAINGKYLVAVGTIEPRKNYETLIRGFARLSDPGLTLVIAGGRGWGNSSLPALVEELGLKDKIKFIGYVQEDDLSALYSGAEFYVCASLYEGFGLPNLEAMACGKAVCLSDLPVFREAAGDAALYFQNSAADLARVMSRFITDQNLRREYEAKVRVKVREFSWPKSAAALTGVFNELRV